MWFCVHYGDLDNLVLLPLGQLIVNYGGSIHYHITIIKTIFYSTITYHLSGQYTARRPKLCKLWMGAGCGDSAQILHKFAVDYHFCGCTYNLSILGGSLWHSGCPWQQTNVKWLSQHAFIDTSDLCVSYISTTFLGLLELGFLPLFTFESHWVLLYYASCLPRNLALRNESETRYWQMLLHKRCQEDRGVHKSDTPTARAFLRMTSLVPHVLYTSQKYHLFTLHLYRSQTKTPYHLQTSHQFKYQHWLALQYFNLYNPCEDCFVLSWTKFYLNVVG